MDWMQLEAEYREKCVADFTTDRTAAARRWITLDLGIALMGEAHCVLTDALGNLQDAQRPEHTASVLAEYVRRAKEYNIRMRVLVQTVNDRRRFGLDASLGAQGEYDSGQGLPEALPAMAHMTDKAMNTITESWTHKVRDEAGF